jgi:hypothetical protein
MLTFWLGVSIVVAFLVLIAALGVTLHDELQEGIARVTRDGAMSTTFATQLDPPAEGEETLKVISGCTAILSLMYLIFASALWIRSR